MKKINVGKKVLSMLLVAFLLVTNSLVVGATPRKESAWPQFRGETLNPGVTDSKTPRSSEEIEESWAKKMGTGWSFSDPIVVGSYVYITDSSQEWLMEKESYLFQLEKEEYNVLMQIH